MERVRANPRAETPAGTRRAARGLTRRRTLLSSLAEYVGHFSRLIRFEHSIFALPFAYSGAFLAQNRIPGLSRMLWITVAMVSARSLAMALNRVLDAEIDALNARTAGRELPAGILSHLQVWIFSAASLAVLVFATFNLPPVTRYLWPVVVGPFVIYPLTKRWTWLCHVILGMSIGLGPVGAWVAVTGKVTWEPFLLGSAVALWIAGFDIIYAYMDVAFDRAQGLHSIPADLGIRAGVWITRAFHTLSIATLAGVGLVAGAGPLYFAGLVVCAALLFYENYLIRDGDTAKVGTAFGTMNGVISVVFFLFTLADVLA